MPRKQNGFGPAKSFSVGSVNSDFNKGRKIQGSGQYPSDRRFGATVTRSAIQQWNIDSTWAQWRKGYEYARQNAWVNLDVLFFAFLFSGTTSRLRANLRCKRFPSIQNDTATRYVVKREIAPSVTDPRYATVESVINIPPPAVPVTDAEKRRKNNFENNEIWLEVNPRANPVYGDVLKRLKHERITNKRHGTEYTTTKTFESTVKDVLKNNGKPLIYTAVAHKADTTITIKIPRNEVLSSEYLQDPEKDLSDLIGQVIRVSDMPVAMPKTGLTFSDREDEDKEYDPDVTHIKLDMTLTNQAVWLANVDEQDAFEVFVDASPLLILTTRNATVEMKQNFKLQNLQYQKFFDYYINASVIDSETEEMSLIYPPLYIADVSDDGTDIVFKTIPFEATLQLYGDYSDGNPYIVLSDFSFTSWEVQPDFITVNGREIENPAAGKTFNDTSIFPWQDQTWLVGDGIYVADAYACNCPSYSRSMVTSPEALYRKYSGFALNKNRQLKYPLPSALSNKDVEGLSNTESGVIVNWASRRNRLEYKTCKHSVGGIFAEERIEVGFAGFIDASTGLVTSINTVGQDKGLTVGSSLPAASKEIVSIFLVVEVAGNNIDAVPGVEFNEDDICLCFEPRENFYQWTRRDSQDRGITGTGGVVVGTNKEYIVLEPNTYPAGTERENAEKEIQSEIKRVNFEESGPRAEISQIDFAFSTLQLLNLMDTEVGSILGGNVALIPITSNTTITASTMERGIITD